MCNSDIKKSLKITIITVCKNASENIKKTINSVIQQTYSNIEYLILDGKSTDDTQGILKAYLGHKNVSVFSEKDFGIYNAMNRGIARASGDYIYFINAGDTLYNNTVIEDVVKYMGSDSSAIYYGCVKIISPGRMDKIYEYKIKENILEWLLKKNMICHQGIFAPRSSLINHYFKEKFELRADYEWLLYSIQNNVLCKRLPLVIANYDALGQSSSIKNKKKLYDETKMIINELNLNKKNDETYEEKLKSDKTKEEIYEELAEKHFRMFLLMNKWLIVKQNGKSILEFFYNKKIFNIAIYGVSYIGERLLYELNNKKIHVQYLIDKEEKKELCTKIPMYTPYQKLPRVDAIIITAINDFDKIKATLKICNQVLVISFEDIIDYCLRMCF